MTYLGIDVLTIEPHRSGAAEETFARKQARILDPGTGDVAFFDQSLAPAPSRSVVLYCASRAEVAAALVFLDARCGRSEPFWLPSFQADFILDEDVDLGDSEFIVAWSDYTSLLYPGTGARRHIVVYGTGATPWDCYHIADAEDPDDGTEILTISPVAARAYAAGDPLISFLKLVRLEEDAVRISWESGNIATITATVREVPNEAPE